MTNLHDERPWLSSYAPGVPADVDVPRETLVAPLQRAAQQHPEAPALEFFGRTTSYLNLLTSSLRAAAALRAAGVGPGDRVAVALPNCPAHVIACYATWAVGAIVVEINPTYTRDAMAAQLEQSGARVVIAWRNAAASARDAAGPGVTVFESDMAAYLPLVKRLALRLPVRKARTLRSQISGPRPAGVASWEQAVSSAQPLQAGEITGSAADVAMLLFTGGTTGTPKAAMLTHANLVANATQGEAWLPMLKRGKETSYALLPFFHAFGVMLSLIFPIRIAAKVVLFPKFDVTMTLAAFRTSPATFIGGVPPIFERLAIGAELSHTDLSSIKVSLSGAMALPEATAQRWERVSGSLLIEGYGMTESSPIALGNPVSDARVPGALGLPFPSTTVRVVDPDDPTREVEAGQRGELLIKGPQVFEGYWRAPQETANIFIDGYLRTGDIVIMDETGSVRLVDRIKEVIVTGGYNVYPSQVETALASMPEVAEVAVVGLPSSDLGERVVAAIVLAQTGAQVDMDKVRSWCATTLARYAIPRDVVILPELPRSQIGKVLRRVVREQLISGSPA